MSEKCVYLHLNCIYCKVKAGIFWKGSFNPHRSLSSVIKTEPTVVLFQLKSVCCYSFEKVTRSNGPKLFSPINFISTFRPNSKIIFKNLRKRGLTTNNKKVDKFREILSLKSVAWMDSLCLPEYGRLDAAERWEVWVTVRRHGLL